MIYLSTCIFIHQKVSDTFDNVCMTVKKKLKVESLTWKHLLSFRFYQSAKTFTGILLDIYKKTKLAP